MSINTEYEVQHEPVQMWYKTVRCPLCFGGQMLYLNTEEIPHSDINKAVRFRHKCSNCTAEAHYGKAYPRLEPFQEGSPVIWYNHTGCGNDTSGTATNLILAGL